MWKSLCISTASAPASKDDIVMAELEAQTIWQQACGLLQQHLTPTAYQTWIMANPLTEYRLVGEDRGIGVITSPTTFHASTLEKNFYAQIKEVLDQVTGRNSELQFKVGAPENQTTTVQAQPIKTQVELPVEPTQLDSVPSATTFSPPPVAPPAPIRRGGSHSNISLLQTRLKELAEKQQSLATVDPHRQEHSPTSGLFAESTIRSVSLDRAKLQAQKAGLRLDYTFETFAVSTTNELAHAAAYAVSNQPGTAYNPLFIYGGVGVGKTHLMHAVGNNILKNNPDSKILYCTGEDFTNEIVNAIQTKKAMQFKEKYRTVDILLIDDVQFIAGKNTVQEEFFHTFNTITKRAGQIIMTSDRPPSEMSLLEDRLRSRFEAGLMVDIQQPSFELRTAILLIKSNAMNIQLPMDLAQIVATRVDSARKLEGFLKSIKSEVELKHRSITPELIDELCKVEQTKPVSRLRVKPYDVIKIVSDYYHVKQTVLRGKIRLKSIVRARHMAMYILKEELKLPYMEIGRWFSNRDHTSAIHALRKVTAELAIDPDLKVEYETIRSTLEKISR